MKQKLIAVAGFKGSGKDTIGNLLVNEYGFVKDSFAAPLKDACAGIFDWPRDLLEGDTEESREWREQIDKWWAQKLEMPNFSPRRALQYIGTEILRRRFNDDLWLLSLENRFLKHDESIVVTDCRFQNELSLVRKLNGITIQVNRGPKPDWWDIATVANTEDDDGMFEYLECDLGIHASEYSWVGAPVDIVIENDGTISDLHQKVRDAWQKISCM